MLADEQSRPGMRHRVGRRDVLRGIGGTTAVGLAGCLGGDGGTESVGREIRLGILMGTSGRFDEIGPPVRDAAQLVPDQVDGADTDFTVDARFEDTGASPEQGVARAEALIDAGYPMLCGALHGPVNTLVATTAAVPQGVTMCTPAITSAALSDLDDDGLVFRTVATEALQGRMLAKLAAERRGADIAATLYRDDAYGSQISQGFVAGFEDTHDGTVTDEVAFEPGADSYAGAVEQALAGAPGLLVLIGYPSSGVQLFGDLSTAADPGDLAVLVSDGLQSSNLRSQVDYDLRGVGGTSPSTEGPGLSAFRSTYESSVGTDSGSGAYVRQAYDAAATLVLANAAADENDGRAVRDQMRAVTGSGGTEITAGNLIEGLELAARGEAINYQGVAGPVAFDSNGDLSTGAYDCFEFTADGLEVVEQGTV